jgi:hypothetical protein
MFNVIVVVFSLAIVLFSLRIINIYLGHKAAMERKEMLKDAKSVFIG